MTTTLTNVQLLSAKRLPNSINGNPRFVVTIDNGESLNRYYTQSDADCSYDVENYVKTRGFANVTLTRAGRIASIQPGNKRPYDQYTHGRRCANCGSNVAGARTLVIDWREDYLCDPCVDSFDWSTGWHYDGVAYRRCCTQSTLTPGQHSTGCLRG